MVHLREKANGYYGYLSEDVREALGKLQDVVQHLTSEIQYTPDGDLAEHSLNVMSGGLNCFGELAVVSGYVVLNANLVPVHADNAAAGVAGIEVGQVYVTPAGALMMHTL
jgi:hypothetical protein